MVHRVAIIASAFALFAMAAVGVASDVPAESCAIRAIIGAIVMYLVARFAGKCVMRVIADAYVRDMASRQDKSENGSK